MVDCQDNLDKHNFDNHETIGNEALRKMAGGGSVDDISQKSRTEWVTG
jgi:hypothetical protein